MIYWVLLFALSCLYYVNRYSICLNRINNKTIYLNGKHIYIFFAIIVLVLIAGLRSSSVGMDTEMYKQLYQYVKESASLSSFLKSWQRGGTEIGYVFLEYIFSRFASFQFFLLIVAFLSIVPTIIVMHMYSKNLWFSLFLYFSFGYYTFCFTGLRQAIAMGLCMIAFIFSNKNKLVPYIIFVVLAVIFHSSAIIFLPVYWLKKIEINKYTIGLYLFFLSFANIFKHQIFSFINLFSRQQYASVDDAGGIKMYIFMLGVMAIIYIFRKQYFDYKKNDTNKSILIIFAISTIIWPISSANAAVFRLYYYYQIFLVILLPNFLSSIENKCNKVFFYVLFIFVGAILLQFYVVWSALKFEPYQFFWQ